MTYGYGNARLRAMRSRLISRDIYDDLLARAHAEEVITRLGETPYRDDIEGALVRLDGVECVFQAAHTNLTRTLRQIREFYQGEPRELVDLLLRRWDRHNLLTILRGQVHRISPDSVLAATVPVGQIGEAPLRELARQPGLQAAVDVMTIWKLPYASVLREVRARTGVTPDLEQLELALNRAHYAIMRADVGGGSRHRDLVLEYLNLEVDILNVGIALRLTQAPELSQVMARRYGVEKVEALLIEPGGHLSAGRLGRLVAEGGGMEEIVHDLSASHYGDALKAGWNRYQAGEGSVSVVERELERWLAMYSARLFTRDPLGIAVCIGYLSCKAVEVANLRLVAEAVALNLAREPIRRELIYV